MNSIVQRVPDSGARKIRVAVLLAGLGRVNRGAEVAFLELSKCWSTRSDVSVHLFGSGEDFPECLPHTVVDCTQREKFESWPKVPVLRSSYCYEEATFVLGLWKKRAFRKSLFDIAVHCTFPFTNWMLRGGVKSVFVTQNGDWMCRPESKKEYRTFRCDGLVCTNPEYLERHRLRHNSKLIPNGVDPVVFHPHTHADKEQFQLPPIPAGFKVVLISSAMIPSKRIIDGIRALAEVPNAFLVVAGDGPERPAIQESAQRLLPHRHLLLGSLPRQQMPALYRRADAFLHLSQDESFGNVYLEAAASGLPMVVHDAATPRWILGKSSEYADTGVPSAVAAALRLALEPERAKSLGELARKRVESAWAWDVQAAKYVDFFQSLTQQPSRDMNS
jgi:glycosyltransferase involved in cell wall biosynthesis